MKCIYTLKMNNYAKLRVIRSNRVPLIFLLRVYFRFLLTNRAVNGIINLITLFIAPENMRR